MKIIFTVQHPAHVHLFRQAIDILQDRGAEVHVFAREKDIAIELLDIYEIDHTVLAGKSNSLGSLTIRQAQYELNLLRHARQIRPDVMVAMGEPGVAHVSSLLNCPGIIFTDTEYATLQNTLAFPFADRICTPTCYQDNIGDKQISYRGYHELAYLHPNRFTPDPEVLHEQGLTEEDSFAVMRLNAWNAAHFRDDAGFTNIQTVLDRIEASGTKVLITSEPDLPESLNSYRVDVPLDKIHDLLYYADLFIGESSTMASESAVLGTPAIFVSTSRRGYTNELGDRYGLVYTLSGTNRQEVALEKAINILNEYDTKKWERRHERLLADKIDATEFIIDQIEAAALNGNYNGSSESGDSTSSPANNNSVE